MCGRGRNTRPATFPPQCLFPSMKLAELPDDQDIVAYCRGAYCVLAHEAVRLLTDHGRSAMRLADGMLERRLADLPVAT